MGKTEKPKSTWEERKKDIKHKWLSPFIYIEWLCEWLSYILGRWALLDILGHVGRLTILTSFVIGVSMYWLEADERKEQAENQRKAKHFQAWQVINAAHGKPGSGGRIDALQDLNNDKVSLADVDLANANLKDIHIEKADLADANFSGANLADANLSEANLRRANLSEAELRWANLSRAKLQYANLSEAYLTDANLSEANLKWANLSRAFLVRANLSGANLYEANLSRASLDVADLSGAFLHSADLSGADLSKANLFGAILVDVNLPNIQDWENINSIEFANIYDVRNEPDGFIEWAKEHGAKILESEDECEALFREIQMPYKKK